MFNLDTNEQEVNLADDDVFQMVPGYPRSSSESSEKRGDLL